MNFTYIVYRNVLAAATPYFQAMFTSGLIESDFEARWSRGSYYKSKHRQKLVLQGIKQSTLEVTNHLIELTAAQYNTIQFMLGLNRVHLQRSDRDNPTQCSRHFNQC